MARLLILACLAFSAFGCGAFGNTHDRQEVRADRSASAHDQDLELRAGGPNDSALRRNTEGNVAGDSVAIEIQKVSSQNRPEQQVKLRITIAEVDRPDLKALGFDVGDKEGDDSTKLPWILDSGKVQLVITSVLARPRQESGSWGRAHVLTERTLAARSGEAMMCESNGVFENVDYRGYSGSNGVSGMPYAVQLSVTPTVTGANHVRLAIHAKISRRDTSASTSAANPNAGPGRCPGLSIRNLNTTFEMPVGQTFAVAGLVENNFEKRSKWDLLLARIPIVDNLVDAESRMIAREMVMLVTPEIISALKPNE